MCPKTRNKTRQVRDAAGAPRAHLRGDGGAGGPGHAAGPLAGQSRRGVRPGDGAHSGQDGERAPLAGGAAGGNAAHGMSTGGDHNNKNSVNNKSSLNKHANKNKIRFTDEMA
eukprot:1179412-Prorocentrum_minimum.AAC.3